jgi:hypothetical protein
MSGTEQLRVVRLILRQRKRAAELRSEARLLQKKKEAEEQQRLEAEKTEADRKAEAEYKAAAEAHRLACELWAEYDALEKANKPCPKELLDKCLATPRPKQYVPTAEERRRTFSKKKEFEVKHFVFKADPTLDGYCGGGVSAGRVIRSSRGLA